MFCISVGSLGLGNWRWDLGGKVRPGGGHSAELSSEGLSHNPHAFTCFFPGCLAEESNSHTKGDREV